MAYDNILQTRIAELSSKIAGLETDIEALHEALHALTTKLDQQLPTQPGNQLR